MQLTGFHHLTAVTADAPRNHAFYTQTLGLRLVKKTVNQDDVSAYHLFYADGRATPGTDITFFDWPLPRERRGTHSIVRTGLRVANAGTLAWWERRFAELGVSCGKIVERDGRPTLDFEDFEGQRLSLVVDETPEEAHPWERSPVPVAHQIRGLGPITISVPDVRPTDSVLTEVMSLRHVREYAMATDGPVGAQRNVHVYAMGAGPPADSPPADSTGSPRARPGETGARGELHVLVEPGARPAAAGAGGVHHVAFRTPTFEEYDAWAERLVKMDMKSSGPVDRFYFRSLYFREPNGILFEIATDGPGFGADEPMDALGERLALPPFLEPRREAIEQGLRPLET